LEIGAKEKAWTENFIKSIGYGGFWSDFKSLKIDLGMIIFHFFGAILTFCAIRRKGSGNREKSDRK
jgi:hypothetical protein